VTWSGHPLARPLSEKPRPGGGPSSNLAWQSQAETLLAADARFPQQRSMRLFDGAHPGRAARTAELQQASAPGLRVD